jgi:hypothetical protein
MIPPVLLFLSVLLLAFMSTPPPAHAQGTLYVAPSGDDANDCATTMTACRTLQRAIKRVPITGVVAMIKMADGIYTGPADVAYYRFVVFEGNCSNPAAVTVRAPSGRAAFWAQDHAIVGVTCLTVEASGPRATGIASRQYAIVDYHRVRFGSFPDGIHVSAQEGSRQNCLGGIEIIGDAATHANAGYQSFLSMSCNIVIPAPRKFVHFVVATFLSTINLGGARITGAGVAGTTGGLFTNSSVIVLGGTTLPDRSVTTAAGGIVQ